MTTQECFFFLFHHTRRSRPRVRHNPCSSKSRMPSPPPIPRHGQIPHWTLCRIPDTIDASDHENGQLSSPFTPCTHCWRHVIACRSIRFCTSWWGETHCPRVVRTTGSVITATVTQDRASTRNPSKKLDLPQRGNAIWCYCSLLKSVFFLGSACYVDQAASRESYDHAASQRGLGFSWPVNPLHLFETDWHHDTTIKLSRITGCNNMLHMEETESFL